MKLIKFLLILIAIVIGVTTACCQVQFDTSGYDVFLTVRWNRDLRIGINVKEGFEFKVFGTDNLLANSDGRIAKQLDSLG
ncbi:hypothetical protein ACFL3D_02685 [Candidatus Omnitrophota bacterium]